MEDVNILGYNELPDGSWEPLYECKKDYIYTAAVVNCKQCGTFLRSMGGPLYALCLNCFNGAKKEI